MPCMQTQRVRPLGAHTHTHVSFKHPDLQQTALQAPDSRLSGATQKATNSQHNSRNSSTPHPKHPHLQRCCISLPPPYKSRRVSSSPVPPALPSHSMSPPVIAFSDPCLSQPTGLKLWPADTSDHVSGCLLLPPWAEMPTSSSLNELSNMLSALELR